MDEIISDDLIVKKTTGKPTFTVLYVNAGCLFQAGVHLVVHPHPGG